MTNSPKFSLKKLFAATLTLCLAISLGSLKAEETPSQDSVSLLSKEQPSENEALTSKILEESPSTLQPHYLSAATLPFLGSVALGSKALPGLRPLFSFTQRWWLKGLFSTLALGYLARKVIPSLDAQNLDLGLKESSPLQNSKSIYLGATSVLASTSEQPAQNQAPKLTTEASEKEHAPYPKPMPPFPPDFIFPQNELDKWTDADHAFTKALSPHLEQNSQALKSIFKHHLLKDTPDFYEKLSEATLMALLQNLDPGKLFFTQQHVFDLRREFGTTWLQDMVENKDFGILWALHGIKEKIALHYFKLLSENPLSLELPPNTDPFPVKWTDFAADHAQQQLRWSQTAQLLNIIFKHSYPQATDADLKGLMSQFYQKKLSGLASSYLASGKLPTTEFRLRLLSTRSFLLKKSLFDVFSRFTYFEPVTYSADYLILGYQDAWVQFRIREGLFRIVTSQAALQEKARFRSGDIVLAIKHADTPEEDSTLEPLLFVDGRAQNLAAAAYSSLYPKEDSFPKNNLIFTLLRQKSEGLGYDLIEKVIFTKKENEDGSLFIEETNSKVFEEFGPEKKRPAVSHEEGQLLHQNSLFSATVYPMDKASPEMEKVAVLDLPSFLKNTPEGAIQETRDRLKQNTKNTLWDRFSPAHLYQHHQKLNTTMNLLLSLFEQTYKLMAADNVSSFVLDLRANNGGFTSAPFTIMHAFRDARSPDLPSAKNFRTAYEFSDSVFQRRANHTTWLTRSALNHLRPLRKKALKKLDASRINNIPLVILVGENTASAAEYFAGELQAHGRALIVGSHTYGKGTSFIPAIKKRQEWLTLTTDKLFTSAGTSPHEVGVPLDIVIPTEPAERAFIKALQPPQAFTDQELSSQGTPPQPQNDLLTINPALRDPELIQSLQNAFDDFLQEDEYFSQLHSLWEQKKASRVGGELSLKAADYELHSYEKEHPNKLVTPRLPEDASWLISGDVELDQALWIAQKYAELLDSQKSPP